MTDCNRDPLRFFQARIQGRRRRLYGRPAHHRRRCALCSARSPTGSVSSTPSTPPSPTHVTPCSSSTTRRPCSPSGSSPSRWDTRISTTTRPSASIPPFSSPPARSPRTICPSPRHRRSAGWRTASTARRWSVFAEVLVDQFIAAHPTPPEHLILDFDATDDLIHGKQEGRFFHGYYDHHCFLPLYVFCGDELLAAYLRPSNIDAAKHTRAVLKLLVQSSAQLGPM